MPRTEPSLSPSISARHETRRVRHELKMRLLCVSRMSRLTPNMVRVTLTGDDLPGFVSAGFDDHVKLFFPPSGVDRPVLPTPGANGPVFPDSATRPEARDFTPRLYDPQANELVIDFALHEAGPAANWAADVQPGQWLGVGGPRGSFVVPDDFDWTLLVGDETALPAIGRRLEELREGTVAIVIAEVADPAEEFRFSTGADLDIRWIHRGNAEPGDPALLDAAVADLHLPSGDGHAWVACESSVAKILRRRLIEQHGQPRQWLKAAGYWKRGTVASHETHDD